jgi:hypothetical protein|tara:strand:+ start:1990 stop:2814 length:825 start_codon:yes stop_codon:yes gene_type:complete
MGVSVSNFGNVRKGSITTPIIADGLVLNIDAFNVNCLLPYRQDDDYSSIGSIYSSVDNGRGQRLTTGSIKDNSTIGGWQGPTTSSFYFGSNDLIELNKSTADLIPSNSSFTIGAFMKFQFGSYFADILGFSDHPPEANELNVYADVDNQDLSISFNNTTHVGVYFDFDWSGPGVNDLNKWFYLTWVYQVGSAPTPSKLTGYLNGLKSVANNTNSTTTNSYTSPTTNAQIGHTGVNQQNKWVSNVQIYNRALTQTEVQHNFNALKGRFPINYTPG